jgi:UDP-N-acetylmuramyl pentapeptide phosphotransferase/UDP-N-acetylglucosamine-1-phosphate transferase
VVVLAALLAALSAGAAAPVREALLASSPDRLLLTNFRERQIPAVGGLVILAGLLASESVLTLVGLLRPGTLGGNPSLSASSIARTFGTTDHVGILLVALAFFALGTIDDLAGAGRARGFSGHIRALAQGRVTGGAIKAAGGGMAAFIAAAQWHKSPGEVFLDAAIVALAANLINLLDLRPGRAIKFFLLAWTPIVAAGWTTPYFAVSAAVAAASAVWLPADLKEKGMLGDGGANLVGAVLGAGLALTLSLPGRLVAVGVLALLTIFSELRPFSSSIDEFPPLRWFDALGRVPG